jgi:hypothetical protein
MNRNYRLLDEIVHIIETEPEKWNQGYWGIADFAGEMGEVMPACQTAKCIAGWAVSLRDYDLIFDGRTHNTSETCQHIVTGRRENISATARVLLGLDVFDADKLFDGTNTLDQIEGIIHDWKVADGIIKPTCDECGQELPSVAPSDVA